MFDQEALRKLEQLIASAAEDELMSRFCRVKASDKADGTLITEADLQMQARVIRELAVHWPEYALLGEEMTAAQQQDLLQETDRGLWCLDPLDGTSNFASGIPFFGVSLALLADGLIQVGLVYDPVRREAFSAIRGQGAWLNGEPLRISRRAPALSGAMAIVDLKRLPEPLILALAKKSPYRSQRSFGSVALDWCWLASERMQVYLHGGQKLWDYAAGSLILAEAGGAGGIFEDYADTRMQSLTLQPRIGMAATSDALFADWRSWLQEALS